ncbi:hypothetical protein HYH03_015063 [Edaphochlamys debaryana]|uniref:Uncharacterized protein n=1 Tax=Edaphochlamys debaryana TaxID=47281 RepID=A0A836BSX8_9CHLO|nr:hypothetical protein HYH03_015063 [Edaphochlamys debaryana]|eukprot:KAG2486238.1 hypothetical protein HYH03_015063 [Edaphochlamys debaryana]
MHVSSDYPDHVRVLGRLLALCSKGVDVRNIYLTYPRCRDNVPDGLVKRLVQLRFPEIVIGSGERGPQIAVKLPGPNAPSPAHPPLQGAQPWHDLLQPSMELEESSELLLHGPSIACMAVCNERVLRQRLRSIIPPPMKASYVFFPASGDASCAAVLLRMDGKSMDRVEASLQSIGGAGVEAVRVPRHTSQQTVMSAAWHQARVEEGASPAEAWTTRLRAMEVTWRFFSIERTLRAEE